MDVAVFSSKIYDRQFLAEANVDSATNLTFLEPRLSMETVGLARDHEAVCVFVNDELDASVLAELTNLGVRLVALRCAGFNNIDLQAAARLKLKIARVPAYSPHAVAEHTMALMLALIRKTHRAYNRVREGNFALDGLLGFDLAGKTVGVVGTGQIGSIVVQILFGFGCRVVGLDPHPNPDCSKKGVRYVDLEELAGLSDIITLHCPLTPQTYHLISNEVIALMRPGAIVLNTSRGAVLDTRAVIAALKRNKIGGLGIDVYEEEANLFFEDLSNKPIQDDVFARLLTFPNVIVTGHQGFFTKEALTAIANTTIQNIIAFEETGQPVHEVSLEKLAV